MILRVILLKFSGAKLARAPKASDEPPFTINDAVPVGRVFLSLSNPRHEPVDTEAEAIERLCGKENILALAKDIVRYGLSPLERFAMSPTGTKKAGSATFYVEEGNR